MHRVGGFGMLEVAEALSLMHRQHSALKRASELSGDTNARDICEAARQTWMSLQHRRPALSHPDEGSRRAAYLCCMSSALTIRHLTCFR